MKEHPLLLSAPLVRAALNTQPDVWPARAIDPGKPFKWQTRRLAKNLRVRVRGMVRSDDAGLDVEPIIATRGVYSAEVGRAGAVSINVRGKMLGVKPGEFDFVCPYSSGETTLVNDGDGEMHWEVQAGDGVWFRETWAVVNDGAPDVDVTRAKEDAKNGMPWSSVAFRADANGGYAESHRVGDCWRPSIYLPRWACRLTGRIRRLRLEFLQDITGPDIVAEGVVARAHVDPHLGKCPVGHDGVMYPDLLSLWAAGWDSINKKRAPWKDNPLVWVIDFERTPT